MSPFLAFYYEHGRAPDLIEKINLCQTLEALEDLLEGARWVWKQGLSQVLGDVDPAVIRATFTRRKAELGKALAKKAAR